MNSGELSVLPTGTVTLLLADTGDEARPLESRSEQVATAVAYLERTVTDLAAAHGGVRPQQAAGDRFVLAFPTASAAVACAIGLQRAPLAPIRLRIAMVTGEVSPAEAGNGMGPVRSRAARLCDLANSGQTLLSKGVERLVADRLPPDTWLADLGSYRLCGDPRPERVTQLCHRDLANDFPPLRTRKAVGERYLPAQLTSFVGREAELADLRRLVVGNRLVTLTGTGGVGKTRLALRLAGELVDEFAAGVWWVDLAPLTAPDLVAQRVAHALGLNDQPGHCAVDTLIGYIEDSQTLVVLDNCEHLLDGCSALVATLLAACPRLTIVATSREPVEVAGEVIWLTPPLPVAGAAVELFTQRARLARPDFARTGDDVVRVAEICRRLDGVPLAIELAATRVRALSLAQIADGLSRRLDLLTGGARTVVPRHQTLRASEEWSHGLLSEPERVVFRRLAVFLGGFDLAAADAVAGGPAMVNTLAQLVDRSLVIADNTGVGARYRMLETVRQYAAEKLDEAGEADVVRTRHRDHYTTRFGAWGSTGCRWRIDEAEIELSNLRAAFTWSRERGDIDLASRLASSLLPLWIRSRIEAGLDWFDAVLTDSATVAPAARGRALADKVILEALTGDYSHLDQAEQAMAIARDLDDPALLAWALAACGCTCCYNPSIALPYLQEAVELAPALGDDWRSSQVFGAQALSAFIAGDVVTLRRAAEQGRDLADAIDDEASSRLCRWYIGLAQWLAGDVVAATVRAREVASEARAARDTMFTAQGLMLLGLTLAYQGDTTEAREAAEAGIEAAAGLPAFQRSAGYAALADALLAAGEVPAAVAASQACAAEQMLATNSNPVARAALAAGDVAAARRWTDGVLAAASGVHRMIALAVRVRVEIAQGAQGDVVRAERDASDALAIAAETEAYLAVPEVIDCLAALAVDSGRHREAARLFGSAAAIRDRTGLVRFAIYDADHAAAVDALRDAMGQKEFEQHWAGGAALSTVEAVAYARAGPNRRGGLIRPPSGWASLTPAERDIVQLVGEGLRNKDIAARLFISARTVQAHLTHIYAKLGLSSRVQLVQEAGRHS